MQQKYQPCSAFRSERRPTAYFAAPCSSVPRQQSRQRETIHIGGGMYRARTARIPPQATLRLPYSSSLAGALLVVLRCRPRYQELSSALTSRCHDLWTTPPTHNISKCARQDAAQHDPSRPLYPQLGTPSLCRIIGIRPGASHQGGCVIKTVAPQSRHVPIAGEDRPAIRARDDSRPCRHRCRRGRSSRAEEDSSGVRCSIRNGRRDRHYPASAASIDAVGPHQVVPSSQHSTTHSLPPTTHGGACDPPLRP